jgi:hypothetical protein
MWSCGLYVAPEILELENPIPVQQCWGMGPGGRFLGNEGLGVMWTNAAMKRAWKNEFAVVYLLPSAI